MYRITLCMALAMLAACANASQVLPPEPPAAGEDWEFTPQDYAALTASGKDLTIAPDSLWVPRKLQENVLATLRSLLDPQRVPSATEGINIEDFDHGHIAIPRDTPREREADAMLELRNRFMRYEDRAYPAALGNNLHDVNADNLDAFEKAVRAGLPLAREAIAAAAELPDASVVYHTFELKSPKDLEAIGDYLRAGDPRRNWRTPFATMTPGSFKAPNLDNASSIWQQDVMVLQFCFTVDNRGQVHIRPGHSAALSGITGKPYK